MKSQLALLAFMLLLLSLLPSAHASDIVYGQVSTPIVENWYDLTKYYCFNFTVYSSNSTWQGGEILQVIVNASLLTFPPLKDQFYNFTGFLNTAQISEIPVGVFVVESVVVQHGNWWDSVKQIIGYVSTLTGTIVALLAQLIFTQTGIQVPEAILTAIVSGIFLFGIIKYWKTVGLFLACIIVALLVSGGANFIRLIWV